VNALWLGCWQKGDAAHAVTAVFIYSQMKMMQRTCFVQTAVILARLPSGTTPTSKNCKLNRVHLFPARFANINRMHKPKGTKFMGGERYLVRDDGAIFLWTAVLAAQNNMREITRAQAERKDPLPILPKDFAVESDAASEPTEEDNEEDEPEAASAVEADAETESGNAAEINTRLPQAPLKEKRGPGRPPTVHPVDRLQSRAELVDYGRKEYGVELSPDMTRREMRTQLKELESAPLS